MNISTNNYPGTLLYGPLKVLQQFHVQPCKHDPMLSPTKCLTSVLKRNKHKFMVATQVCCTIFFKFVFLRSVYHECHY